MRKLLIICLLLSSFFSFSQADHSHRLQRAIRFPDIPGYKTLKCDLHIHTVFSDGSVWPDIRVLEALMDGVDAISLTEHLEYQPHKNDIPHPDRNRSFEIAMEEAKNHALIIIRGSEITRNMPPGHSNAVFITDANKLLIKDSIEVFREAKRQGAFVFWNHPNWTAQRTDGIATITEVHRKLIREKLLDGIEVVNESTYSDEALKLALDNNLTIMGTSDIHGLVDWKFGIPQGGHRPVTIVFAKEKSEASIKDALMNRRTVVFHKDLLIGRNEFLIPLVEASLRADSARYTGKSVVAAINIENLTNADFILRNRSNFTFHEDGDVIVIKGGQKKEIQVKTLQRLQSIDLKFEVLNAINAPASHPEIVLRARVTGG